VVLLDAPWPAAEPPDPPAHLVPAGADPAIEALCRAHHRALRGYRITDLPTPIPIGYVRAADETHLDHAAWQAAIPALSVAGSPGGHESMLRHPHARHLAEILREYLRTAIADNPRR
jgi:thioesterase domain-containing protein